MGDPQTVPQVGALPSSDSEIDLYRTFDSFPWSKTVPFLGALIDTLGGAHNLAPKETHVGTTTFCRGVFYQRQAGIQIDVINYIAFVSRSPGYPSIDARLVEAILETRLGLSQELEVSGNATLRLAKAVAARPPIDPFEDYDASEARSDRPTAPAWQHTAPRTELRIKRDQPGVPQDGQGTGDAPSSARFAAVAAAIQSGQPLEGVREIPDRVEQPPGVTPMGTRAAPRKPWETDTGDAVGSTGIAFDSYAQMDETFPKAEEDGEGSPPLEN